MHAKSFQSNYSLRETLSATVKVKTSKLECFFFVFGFVKIYLPSPSFICTGDECSCKNNIPQKIAEYLH